MTIHKAVVDGHVRLEVEGAITIYEAASIQSELLENFRQFDSITMELTDVVELDVAGAQVLVSAHKTAEKWGKRFKIETVSPKILESATLMGIDPARFFNQS